jgi:hypothetical protein
VRRRGDSEVGINIGVRKKSDLHGLGPGDSRKKKFAIGDHDKRVAESFRSGEAKQEQAISVSNHHAKS